MVRLIRELANFVFGLIEVVLIFRFILRLFGANAASSFVAWVYDTTQPLLQPFLFAFPTPSIRGGYVLEFTTLFAIFAYAFLAYVIQEVLEIIDSRSFTHSTR